MEITLSPRRRSISQSPKPTPASTYTEILLREYKTLVELLAQLDKLSFKTIQPEVNGVIDQLNACLESQSSTNMNKLEIYWSMRCLKQKMRTHVQHTTLM